MYSALLVAHSVLRWLALAGLLYMLFRAFGGYAKRSVFSRRDNAFRHWTATLMHVQLVAGMILYTQSPIVRYFWRSKDVESGNGDPLFFSLLHMPAMLLAVAVVTAGSALARRKTDDADKFKTILLWYGAALLLILLAIPWPFSPLAQRPYFR